MKKYWDINKKMYIDNILRMNEFYVDYSKEGGWVLVIIIFMKYGKNKY